MDVSKCNYRYLVADNSVVILRSIVQNPNIPKQVRSKCGAIVTSWRDLKWHLEIKGTRKSMRERTCIDLCYCGLLPPYWLKIYVVQKNRIVN